MAASSGFVTINYIENVSGDTDLLDFDAPVIEPIAEEVTVVVEDLYQALREVEKGARQANFRVESRGDTYFIQPPLRAGHSFTLPKDPDSFETAITAWEADGVARAFKLGVFDEIFPPMAMPSDEEEGVA